MNYKNEKKKSGTKRKDEKAKSKAEKFINKSNVPQNKKSINVKTNNLNKFITDTRNKNNKHKKDQIQEIPKKKDNKLIDYNDFIQISNKNKENYTKDDDKNSTINDKIEDEKNSNKNIENKYISFNQNNFIEQIDEEDELRKTNYNYNDFCLIPNKELFKICGTNSDINDINEQIYEKKKLNKCLTYPYEEKNIFMILKQPKEKVKNNLLNNIKEKVKNKSKNKNDNIKKDNNNKYIEIKNNNNINKNEINNYNNHYYIYINNAKEKDKKKEKNNSVNATYINKDEVISNNRKYKIEKIKYSNKDEKNNNSNSNSSLKIKNIKDIKSNEENTLNNFDFNFLNEKIETIRERLNSINVIDALSELAGLQSFKEQKNNDDELYDKSKKLNKEFYDNLDVNFNKIEEFLDNL